jgi:hypothetical protein
MPGRSDAVAGPLAALRDPRTQRVVGIAALVLTTAALGAWRMGWLGGAATPEEPVVVQAPVRPVRPHRAAPAATNPTPTAVSTTPSQPVVMGPEPAPKPATRLAASSGVDAAVITLVPVQAPVVPPPAPQVEEHVTYQYNAIGRRDPFVSLVGGAFVGADVGGDAPPDPGGIKVVGIVWGATDQFAMVEDVRGNSYVLRKGDALQNGVVDELRRDAIVVSIKTDGQSQQVVIPFTRKGEGNDR